MNLRIRFQEVPHSKAVERECERLAEELQEEFPEISRFDLSMTHDGDDKKMHLHITGKDVDMASRAQSRETREVVGQVFDRIRKQMRRRHDKQIFAQRRSVQKGKP
jgi:ribosome-associated translation inhibitor RaiA